MLTYFCFLLDISYRVRILLCEQCLHLSINEYAETKLTRSNIMSSSSSSPTDHFSRRSGKRCCAKGNWSGINIAAMVVGFIVFWPVGLVILYWNIKGRDVKDLPKKIQEKWTAMVAGKGFGSSSDELRTDNNVFNEFQQTQYDRITEIKEEIKSRAGRFNLFRSDAKRRADEQEFKDFMSNNPDSEK